MHYGLPEDVWQQMLNLFRQHKAIQRVTLFGSRALGTQRPGSDVDLALQGDLSFAQVINLAGQLDALETLYSFDVLHQNRLTNPALQDHIHRFGVVIYSAAL